MDTSEQDMHNIVIFTGTALHYSVRMHYTVATSSAPESWNCDLIKFNINFPCLFPNRLTACYVISLTPSFLTRTERMISLALYRKQLYAYLEEKMATVAPNLSALIGETVAARLIQKAGSLTSLAKCPASTVQILGAEKALFRALKTKGNTPKYGLIYHSSFIGRASAKNKGRISRYLSNKCAIASRIDSFIEEPTSAYGKRCDWHHLWTGYNYTIDLFFYCYTFYVGEQLRDQVEERLKFYDTGDAPRKNVDVMSAVAESLRKISSKSDTKASKKARKSTGGEDEVVVEEKKEKKEKKDKKRGIDAVEADQEPVAEDEGKKKKKKKVNHSYWS